MPRGQKSKLRARKKRQQARAETQKLGDAQAKAAAEGEGSSSPPPVAEGASQCSPASGTPQQPQRAPVNTNAAGVSRRKRDVNAKSQDEEKPSTSRASTSTWSPRYDHLSRKEGMIVQLMLCKYTMQEPITKADMMKLINKKSREHFPEIFRRASERLDIIFGLHLKKIKPTGHSYIVISNLELNEDGTPRRDSGCPKNGLLMPLLSMIFLNGNRASEEEIWKFLNMLGIFDGKVHFIFGEPRKLITQDLVQKQYLEYRRVPHSQPPRYEFLWGPRAQAEISKMKVLELLAKMNDITPDALPTLYEEALRDEEERARARAAATDMPTAEASEPPKTTANN
ncbi:melanoma-associated antigen B4-like [Erinaceus europaeus]|uniref:Melanoma-associated antigen B4-like n=1 Tax=Erinaceus europaeus TaxID=9365 RepID=A0A1S2ZG77_ERIEU|nr:melanoma-associated antigen B4-like [Erinaceus europaeus]